MKSFPLQSVVIRFPIEEAFSYPLARVPFLIVSDMKPLSPPSYPQWLSKSSLLLSISGVFLSNSPKGPTSKCVFPWIFGPLCSHASPLIVSHDNHLKLLPTNWCISVIRGHYHPLSHRISSLFYGLISLLPLSCLSTISHISHFLDILSLSWLWETELFHSINQSFFIFSSLPDSTMSISESERVRLSNETLWKQFNSLTTEMVVTKNGRYIESLPFLNLWWSWQLISFRKMFPKIEYVVEGLDPNQHYALFLHIERIDDNRYTQSTSLFWISYKV